MNSDLSTSLSPPRSHPLWDGQGRGRSCPDFRSPRRRGVSPQGQTCQRAPPRRAVSDDEAGGPTKRPSCPVSRSSQSGRAPATRCRREYCLRGPEPTLSGTDKSTTRTAALKRLLGTATEVPAATPSLAARPGFATRTVPVDGSTSNRKTAKVRGRDAEAYRPLSRETGSLQAAFRSLRLRSLSGSLPDLTRAGGL